MRHALGLAAILVIGMGTPAAATTLVLDAAIHTYRAADGSHNYNELSSVWSTNEAFIGIENGPTSLPQYNGRFAATLEFDLGVLPVNAILTGASLSLAPFFSNDSIVAMTSYTASSIISDPARATAGTFITALDVQDIFAQNNYRPAFDVTSTVKSDFSGVAANPVVGFGFDQVVDRCTLTRDNFCVSTLGYGDPASGRTAQLALTFDVPATPPPATSDVPEPASWMMLVTGFGLTGWALRRRKRGHFRLISRSSR